MSDTGSTPARRKPNRDDLAVRRHQARVIALQVLFETDMTDHPLPEVLERQINDQDAIPAVRDHAARLVQGVNELRSEIDERIAVAAPAFPVDQLPIVDRNVLRVATFELLREPAVPAKVAINEAVEIAKRFGGPNASKFVNGSLRTIWQRIDADRDEKKSEADA
ncbi:MAG: transcription antitermination factor NusB [Thermomicrobiales bacterium]|nr:transcription antitermination factor NusB [Thermomicrobiales bacterium]